VRATPLTTGVPGDRRRPSGVQSSTGARPRPPLPPINLDRRQARKRRCGDVTLAHHPHPTISTACQPATPCRMLQSINKILILLQLDARW